MRTNRRQSGELSGSLWSWLNPEPVVLPVLTEHISVDVLIVGAGILGLSTAVHLAEAGVNVAVVDSGAPGNGASGRNTGFIVPSLKTVLEIDNVTARIGPDFAERLIRLTGESGDRVFRLIRRLGIECAAEQSGWLQPAHHARAVPTLEKRSTEWQQRGFDVRFLDQAQTRERIGNASYHGSLFVPTGGQLDTLAYTRGLAQAAHRNGATVYIDSRVSSLQRTPQGWTAATAAGRVQADRVLLATNALVGDLHPQLATSIIPVRVLQIASQPLSPDLADQVLVGRSSVSDTRRHTFAVRWSPDGRLMTGGLVMPGPGAVRRAARYFSGRLEHFFPEVAPIHAEFVWDGVIAVTLDSLPRFVSLAPALDAVIACNGRGIALSTSMGQEIAKLYSNQITPAEFPLPQTRPQPVALKRFTASGVHLYLPWSEFRDWVDTR